MNARDRRGETLFIDARQLGSMETRVLKVFTDEDIAKIANTVQSWKTGDSYEDVAGFCKSASLDEIAESGFVLTPGRFVDAKTVSDDGQSFEEKVGGLLSELKSLRDKSSRLDDQIFEQLRLFQK